MRDLLVSELQQVNGGGFLSDVGSVFTTGLESRELNLVVFTGSLGLIGGALIPHWGVALGVATMVCWTGLEMFVLNKSSSN